MRKLKMLVLFAGVAALVWRALKRPELPQVDLADLEPLDPDDLYAMSVNVVDEVEIGFDDDDATSDGQNWMEALATTSIEDGGTLLDEEGVEEALSRNGVRI